jgi:hypothetical protein
MPENSPPASPQVPPVDPSAIINTAMAVLTKPAEFFKNLKDEKGYQKILVFSIAMNLLYAVLSQIWPLVHGMVVGAIVNIVLISVIGGIVGPFLGAIIIWAVCMAFGSKATWEKAVPIAGYGMAIMPLYGVAALLLFVAWGLYSLLSLAVGLYGLWICYLGAKARMFEAAPEAKPSA